MKRFARVFAVPALLCWCCSFCVTDMGSPLDALGGAPGAYQVPAVTFSF